jgi:trehalose-phosphatase
MRILSEIVEGIQRHGRGVFLFDYDGTLAPIADLPQQARISPQMRRAIGRLLDRPSLALGVLSGRAVSDLRRMLGIHGLYLAGLCGLEIDFSGNQVSHPNAQQGYRLIEMVVRDLLVPLGKWRRAWVENKGLGLTIHYRGVPCDEHVALVDRVEGTLARFGGSIRTTRGPLAIEVLPNFGGSKGTAVREILKRLPYRNPFVLFAGDSENDVEAFAEVSSLGGVTIGVGEDSPDGTQHRLEGPGELATLLQELACKLKAIAPRNAKPMFGELWSGLWRPGFPIGSM